MLEGIWQAAVVSLLSGGLTGGITVAALRVHVIYLREGLTNAHHRIDQLDKRVDETREQFLQVRREH